MELFKVSVAVSGRSIDVVLRAGVVATIETGSHENKVESPQDKVSVIVGEGKNGLAAWVQVSAFDNNKALQVTHEGWLFVGDGSVASLSSCSPATGALSRISSPTAEMLKCQDEADFGVLACCTAYGNGCYVRCCNSCCSDPYRCPGASCCG